MFEFLAILLLIGLFLVFNPYLFRSTEQGAPFFPLPGYFIDHALLLVGLKPGEVFYDLGSGDGRVVLSAGTKGAQAIGIETNLARVLYSRFWIFYFRLGKNVRVLRQDFFATPLQDADVVYCYLMPSTMQMLEPKFKQEMKKGSRLVSVSFPLPTMQPTQVLAPEGIAIYLYQF